MEKNIAHPTDARRYETARRKPVALRERNGVWGDETPLLVRQLESNHIKNGNAPDRSQSDINHRNFPLLFHNSSDSLKTSRIGMSSLPLI